MMDIIFITTSAEQIQTASLFLSAILTAIFYKKYKYLNNQINNEELLENFLND
jgi:hypothetical protein